MDRIPNDTVDRLVTFLAVDSVDLYTKETGLSSFTVNYVLDNGARGVMDTPTTAEIDSTNLPGLYSLLIDEAAMTNMDDANDFEILTLYITHASISPVVMKVEIYRDMLVEYNLDHLMKVAVNDRTDIVEVVDDTVLANIMTKTDGDTSDYDPTTDSLEAIQDNISATVGSEEVPNSDSAIAFGSEGATTYANCSSNNGTHWEITDSSDAGELEATIDVVCQFNIGSAAIPTALTIDGYFNRSGAGGYVVEIYVYNYVTAEYDKFSVGTLTTEMRDRSTDYTYEFALNTSYYCPQTAGEDTIGDVKVRFESTRLDTAGGDVLYLDYVAIATVGTGAVSPDIIADAVWQKPLVDIRHFDEQFNAGHILKRTVAMETEVATEDSTTSFTLTDGIATADAYVGMLLEIRDDSSATRDIEIRRITGWTAGKVITVDRAFSFLPTVDDPAHICGLAYVEAMRGTDSAATSAKQDTMETTLNAIPTANDMVAALKAETSWTAGGTWTFAEIIKVLTAWATGKVIDKTGSSGVYQILDPDDDTTVILEITPSESTPYKDIDVK